jgi:hypothetical protein
LTGKEIAMSEHNPQKPQVPGRYGSPQPPTAPKPPGQPPAGQYPPAQPPAGQYPPAPPPGGQYPPAQPPAGQYPPTTPPAGQYPPAPPPGGQYPPAQPPAGQYPPTTPPAGQFPPAPPPGGQYPAPTPPSQYPGGQHQGQYPPHDSGQGYPSQPPTQHPCPDPCDQDRPWGPPPINPECCSDDRSCCDRQAPCTWDEVEDPCVRASSTACGFPWTKLSCTCESSNADCTCDEWDCGSGEATCVPCKPCEGLIPEDDDGEDPDDGDTPDPDGCSAGLRRQLEVNKRCITSKQTEKARIEADIKVRLEREKDLATLIAGFDAIVDKYMAERYKLICREDCLKGFYRDISTFFQDQQKFPPGCQDSLQAEINAELCASEKAKCCQKNLEWKLEKPTRLISHQKKAEKAAKKAEDAFAQIKDLAKWMGDVFGELEKLKDQIAQAVNDKDPQKHRYAFYLFYWRFVPTLCKRFKVAICCPKKQDTEQQTPSDEYAPGQQAPPPDYAQGQPPAPGGYAPGQQPAPGSYAPPVHIGCLPGDWHPSKITEETLKKLICCAWDFVRSEKEKLQEATAAVDTAKQHLEFIKKKVEEDGKTLEERIKQRIEQVICGGAATR